MEQFRIQGGVELEGRIEVAGAKNHALKLIPAALLCDGPVEIMNVPDISDIQVMLDIFESLGGRYVREGKTVTLEAGDAICSEIPHELSRKVRTAMLFVGPLLSRCGSAVYGQTGGDAIGKRPTDLFDEGYVALGASVEDEMDQITYTLQHREERARFVLPWVSHTVTEALILAAVRGKGEYRIVNAAMEPEVVALCEFLISVGADIEGVGTPIITVRGVSSLQGGATQVIPDRIELVTFAVMGALSAKELEIVHGEPRHAEVVWRMFERMGVPFEISGTTLRMRRAEVFTGTEMRTHEYPGIATDFQPPLVVLLTQATGMSLVHETVFEGRLFYTDLLNKMGANIIMCDPHRVVVHGPAELYGRRLDTPDIRAGIALVLAAMRAEGESIIENIHHIDRGYQDIERRLQAVGANIVREECHS